MSSRLFAFILLLTIYPAMAQESTSEAVEQQASQAVENAAEVVEETVDTAEAAADNAQQTLENTAAQLEEAVEEGAQAAEQAVTETAAEDAGDSSAPSADSAQADLEAKLAACAACHGADGNSVIPQNPKLAGQVPGFIADQLAKFKSGERQNAIMAAQVTNLSDEDMQAIDAFYASQQPQLGAIPEELIDLAKIGEKVYRGGEPSMSISACMSCHGPSGAGIPIRFPRVSGQHIDYLEQQLLAYKSGERVSDVMNPIAFRLSAQQIKALAAYMHALH